MATTSPSMVDRPFGCPPDKDSRRVDTKAKAGNRVCLGAGDPCADAGPVPSKPRCSCGSKLKTISMVDGEPKCGKCFREMMRQARPAKRSKYGVDMSPAGKLLRTRIINGKHFVFDSEGEAKRYDELMLLEKAGYIRRLELQPDYPIWINDKHVCHVVLDFRYWEGQTRQVEDFKGKDTPLSRLKRKLVEAAYPGTKVKVVR